MIQVIHKEDCCGCNGCVQACPVQCISMKTDEEGFSYPVVDTGRCIGCGLCERVCPVLNRMQPRTPLVCYAAKNPDEEIRMKSSSGGVFTMLAERTIRNGGVVFGARFDENWDVIHDYAETIDGIGKFRGSKYVQSRIGDCFKKAKQFLDTGREVLFSGTPCQIAGLKLFLRKNYANLLAVDIICHGVPSPMVWQKYLKEIKAREGEKNTVLTYPISDDMPVITGISFRDKALGWKKYSFALTLAEASASAKNSVLRSTVFVEDPFMRAFLCNYILRPSCNDCPSKGGRSGSDITIADFWGIQNLLPEFDDDKGVTLAILNTEKGELVFNGLDSVSVACSLDDAVRRNPYWHSSVKRSALREYYFDLSMKGVDCVKILDRISRKMRPTLITRIWSRIKRSLK